MLGGMTPTACSPMVLTGADPGGASLLPDFWHPTHARVRCFGSLSTQRPEGCRARLSQPGSTWRGWAPL